MKHFISTILMAPIIVSIMSGSLMILGNKVDNDLLVWVMWQIMLVSTILVFLVVAGLFTSWLFQLIIWRKI